MIFYLLIILVAFNCTNSIDIKDFCFQTETCETDSNCENRCDGKYSFSCRNGLCAIDRYSCQSIRLFSSISGNLRNDFESKKIENLYEQFLSQIADCPSVDYNWTANDVCLNRSCYYKKKIPFRLTSQKMNMIKYKNCDCIDEYSFKCGNNYCAKHKNACNQTLFKLKEKTISFIINKCLKL